jgi:hypothetical protein
MTRAAPVTIMQLHAVIIMPAVKCCLKGSHADTFWFPGIPVRFLDLPNHARVHTIIAPFS